MEKTSVDKTSGDIKKDWFENALSKFKSFDLENQLKFLRRLAILGLVQIIPSTTINSEYVSKPAEPIAITEEYSAQIDGGHVRVLTLRDGTKCLLTNMSQQSLQTVSTLFQLRYRISIPH